MILTETWISLNILCGRILESMIIFITHWCWVQDEAEGKGWHILNPYSNSRQFSSEPLNKDLCSFERFIPHGWLVLYYPHYCHMPPSRITSLHSLRFWHLVQNLTIVWDDKSVHINDLSKIQLTSALISFIPMGILDFTLPLPLTIRCPSMKLVIRECFFHTCSLISPKPQIVVPFTFNKRF